MSYNADICQLSRGTQFKGGAYACKYLTIATIDDPNLPDVYYLASKTELERFIKGVIPWDDPVSTQTPAPKLLISLNLFIQGRILNNTKTFEIAERLFNLIHAKDQQAISSLLSEGHFWARPSLRQIEQRLCATRKSPCSLMILVVGMLIDAHSRNSLLHAQSKGSYPSRHERAFNRTNLRP